jgi:RimJ/RimL family protein N-acetyltransferase
MPPQIETSRLILRPFTREDLDAAYAALKSHPDTWRFDPGFQRTKEQRAAIIRKYAA